MNPASSIRWMARMRYYDALRVREFEFARRVGRGRKLIALDCSDARGWDDSRLSGKLMLRWDMVCSRWSQWDNGPIPRFRMPVVVATGPVTNRIAAWINERRVMQAIEKFGCGTVFH